MILIKKIIKICLLSVVLMFILGFKISPEYTYLELEPSKVTAEEFKMKMEADGYEIQNKLSQYSENDSIEEVYFATGNNGEYQIEFYQFSDKNHAVKFFEDNEFKIKKNKNSTYYSESIINLFNYTVYALNAKGSYKVVSRIDNTVVYSVASSEYMEKINESLYELGYIEDFDEFFDNIFIVLFGVWFLLIIFASLWKLFVKADKEGLESLIPFYNYYILAEITCGNGWKSLLLLIPFVNVICLIYFFFKLAKVYGKSFLFGLGLLFLFPVFFPVLAFGKAQYKGVN